ncbi:transglutaminase-like domain-containing protein [Arthrobacter mobilis]|uniref:Transglutaminase family protein n=1 Tax=Arthrobacter mobilis TaxID=2724944 RepID=A0A7X6HE76_9MICC|nr:transglutaminase family protein [Arthrobacter mobilis]NKX54629.1 transglutaminase family protein [Arthrobacter mobilis]
MRRAVSARIAATTTANTSMVFAVAAVRNPGFEAFEEQLTVLVNSEPVPVRELSDVHGGRLHVLTVAEPSTVELEYTATVEGSAVPEAADEVELIKYVRPSRYCESDHLLPTSYAEFGGLRGTGLLAAVRDWVGRELRYVSGSSRHTDGAVQTLLARRGVCRDYAHLVVSLLRAKDVPARLAAVYAPGLEPMDFHAVAEAYVDGAWHVVDATGLASRHSLLRIATGRDASDTAFLSTVGGSLSLTRLKVTAEIDEPVPDEDPAALVQLG